MDPTQICFDVEQKTYLELPSQFQDLIQKLFCLAEKDGGAPDFHGCLSSRMNMVGWGREGEKGGEGCLFVCFQKFKDFFLKLFERDFI